MAEASPSPRDAVLGTLAVALVASGFALLFWFRGALFQLFIAAVLGTALRPLADALGRRARLSRRTAATIIYVALLLLLGGAFLVVVPSLVNQVAALLGKLPALVDGLGRQLHESPSIVLQRLGRDLPQLFAPERGAAAPFAASQAVDLLGVVQHGILVTIAVALAGYYWLLEGDTTLRTVLLVFASRRHEAVRTFVEEAEARVGGYVRGQVIVCSASALMAVTGFWLMGLPNALVLGIFFGMLGVVPVFGAPLGALPAFLMAASAAPHLMFWVVVNAAVVHVMQDYVIAPFVVGRQTGVNPFVVLVSIVAFGSLLGIAGALLAIPLAAILQLIFERLVVSIAETAHVPEARDHRSVLLLRAKELALDVRKQSREPEPGQPPHHQDDLRAARIEDQVESLATAIARLLEHQPRRRAA